MNAVELSKILRHRGAAQRDAADGVNPLTAAEMADNAELLIVLARIVEGKDISRAFGAPGDWGYNSPIGQALRQKSPTL
jgi:hypothetical protein